MGPSLRLLAPHERLALRHLVRVVGETEVDSSRVNVDPSVAHRLEDAVRHRGALDVPPRTTGAPGRGPARLPRLARLPEGEVVGVLLLRGEVLLLVVHISHHLRN